jgi:hypothetical protein
MNSRSKIKYSIYLSLTIVVSFFVIQYLFGIGDAQRADLDIIPVPPPTVSAGSPNVQNCNPGNKCVLSMFFYPQEENNWCWAACMQMCMKVYNQYISQCEIAKHKINNIKDCCNNDRLCDDCNQPSYPIFDKFGFKSTSVMSFLQPDDLKEETACKHRPICAIENFDGGGAHMVVLFGYLDTLNRNYVCIYDPLPKNIGHFRMLTVEAFRRMEGIFQVNSYYKEIIPNSSVSENIDLPGMPSVEKAWQPIKEHILYHPAAWQIFDTNAAIIEAEKGWGEFSQIFSNNKDLAKIFSFKKTKTFSRMFFEEFIIRKDSLSNSKALRFGREILSPTNILYFPENGFNLAIEVAYKNRVWKTIGVEHSVLSKAILSSLVKFPPLNAGISKFVRVDIPFVNLSFLGYTINSELFLIPLFDYPEYLLLAGVPVSANTFLPKLINTAKSKSNDEPG